MSDENISRREDKENLLYIYRKLQLERHNDELFHNDSNSSSDSILPLRYFESDINLSKAFEKEIGPEGIQDPEMFAKTKPFEFQWTHCINSNVGVINLTTADQNELFFASSHLPILYNYNTKLMKCLEGHQHLISSISADQSGQWLVTADDSKDGCIIIWDSREYKPISTLFNIYSMSGTLVVKLSQSARYLITIGVRNEATYSVDFWLWTLGNDEPEDSFEIDKKYGIPLKVCFNPNIEEFIMIICKKQVFLLVWDNEKNKFSKPRIPEITHTTKIGTLTTGTFLINCHECYACSSKGCVLIFGNTLYSKPYEEGELNNSKLYRNAVKVSQHALRSCTATASSLVIGDASGTILFFDKTIRILYWIRKYSLAPIVSISFNMISGLNEGDLSEIHTAKSCGRHDLGGGFADVTKELEAALETDLPKDASLLKVPFLVNDFFIATADNNVYAIDFLSGKCEPVFIMADEIVSALDVHSESTYLVVGYTSGRLQLINYEKHELICSALLSKEDNVIPISCLRYSPKSMHLICGTANGEIWLLEPIVLSPKIDLPFKPASDKILKITFSPNETQFAYYDNNMTVGLFTYDLKCSEWKFMGKIHSHYESINDIIFIPNHHKYTLYTIAMDRHLIEYNNNDENAKFAVASNERIEQRAIPMTFIYWCENIHDIKSNYLLIADNEHKFKLLDLDTNVPKSVFLAPAFGCFKYEIIKKMMIIPHTNEKYMIFLTGKYLGIHIILPDGNPYNYVGYLGHPSKVADFVCSIDGKFLFTFGKGDHCVFKWKIKIKSVDLMHLMGGKELEPYYCLIEGGKNGWLFQEIKDLFYYMQILEQDNVELPRSVTDTIKVTDLPQLVRTCGFFPTEFELENLMIDITYKNYNETGLLNTTVCFIDFVKLFCNHKPVYGYPKDKIKEAFEFLAEHVSNSYDGEISREELFSTLAYSGECIHPSNLQKLLQTLMRTEDPDNGLEYLPEDISFKVLYEEILGIDMGRSQISSSKHTNSKSSRSYTEGSKIKF